MAIQMSNREKYFVGGAVAFIVVFMAYQFVITPFIDGKKKNLRKIETLAVQLEEMSVMRDEYRDLVQKSQAITDLAGDKDKGFTLFSFLDKLIAGAGLKENVSYMKPSESVQKDTQVTLSLVEMKLQEVDMEKLMNFLYQVETSSNGVFVRGMSLTKTGKDKKLLTAIMQFETVKQES